jgi:YesN/AraC family two-component response regulator
MDTTLCVLIVDDEDAIRTFVRNALSNYEIQEARNGEEALTVIQAAKPDLVITDIRMPQMDGFELADRIKEGFPDIPVIALSGYVTREEAENHDFADFIDKPARLEDFCSAVERALSKA